MDDHPELSCTGAIRSFNRFYTRQIGLLDETLTGSGFSLTEARIIYELSRSHTLTAGEIGERLALDRGYLSRILANFARRRLIVRAPDPSDRRRARISLSARGAAAFADLDARAESAAKAMLAAVPEHCRPDLMEAMQTITSCLSGAPVSAGFILRPHRIGDMGLVTSRQARLYAEEYGWDGSYEALVSNIVASFISGFDPARERCWIAERQGVMAGSVFLVRDEDGAARLRLLYVEPWARGSGLGRRLVSECTRFARDAGYRRIVLWTQSILAGARAIYASEGYRLVSSEPHHSFGHDLIGEIWELVLSSD